MKVYVVVDLEGISGITSGSMIRTGSADWASRGRHIATDEVNAVLEGLAASGAETVWVCDSHDAGENLVRESLHPLADLITGATNVVPMLPGLDGSFDALYLIGFHASMGTLHGHFDHTVTTAAVGEVRLNGTVVGEIGMHAAYAGFHGVPVGMVTGDTAAVNEARALLGQVPSVAVKTGIGRFSARVPAREHVRDVIRSTAEGGVTSPAPVYFPGAPLTASLDFLRSAEADAAEFVPGSVRSGARTVEYTSDDPALTFTAIKAMIKLANGAAAQWAQGLYGSGSRG